jgi:hypothetical protein
VKVEKGKTRGSGKKGTVVIVAKSSSSNKLHFELVLNLIQLAIFQNFIIQTASICDFMFEFYSGTI